MNIYKLYAVIRNLFVLFVLFVSVMIKHVQWVGFFYFNEQIICFLNAYIVLFLSFFNMTVGQEDLPGGDEFKTGFAQKTGLSKRDD